jgi:hypothetical protein
MTHIYVAFMLLESMGYESKRYALGGRVIERFAQRFCDGQLIIIVTVRVKLVSFMRILRKTYCVFYE